MRYGSQEARENTPAVFGGLWPRLSHASERFAPKAWAYSLPIRIPGPSSCLSPVVSMNWGQGGRPVPSCGPLPALHIWPRRSSERMEGMSAALSAQPPLPPPCTDEETTGPKRTNRMCSLGGCHCPSGFPRLWTHSRGRPLRGPSPDVSRQGSGGISAQT